MTNRNLKITNEERIENQKNGQIKRIKKLIEKNKYHEPIFQTFKCKYCGKEFTYDVRAKRITQYYLNNYCSSKCYKESGALEVSKRITTLKNKGYSFDETNIEEVNEKYTEYMSERTKKSYSKWKDTIVKRYGLDFAQKRAKNSKNVYRLKFIKENKLHDNPESLSQEELDTLFLDNFNKITNHGEKILLGLLKKHNNDKNEVHLIKANSIVTHIKNLLNKDFGEERINKMSEEEYKSLYDEYYQIYITSTRKGKKTKEEIRAWKEKHLINNGYNKNDLFSLTDEKIDNLYTEYLSNRFVKLNNNIYVGYKHTQKGWYEFKNGNKPFFYRSSWEKKVCGVLDEMLLDYVQTITEPESITYVLDDVVHHYYADFKIEFKNGKILYIEVKPLSKLNDKINIAKFESANRNFENFIILTENEIFGSDLKKILLNS